MTHEHFTYEDLLQIVELIKSSKQFSEFRLKIGEIEIELRRHRGDHATAVAIPPPPVSATVVPPAASPFAQSSNDARAAMRSANRTWASDSIVVRAPMVGTFYRASAPESPPFVDIGQVVEPDTTVCIIEVMKLMNSIPAGVRGVVTQILANDGASVDTGAPLIVLDPRPGTQ